MSRKRPGDGQADRGRQSPHPAFRHRLDDAPSQDPGGDPAKNQRRWNLPLRKGKRGRESFSRSRANIEKKGTRVFFVKPAPTVEAMPPSQILIALIR